MRNLFLALLGSLLLVLASCEKEKRAPIKIRLSSSSAKSSHLTAIDKDSLQLKSTSFIKSFEKLMNQISDPKLTTEKRRGFIKNSFTKSSSQIFQDADVIIEDDIDPGFTNGSEDEKNVKVERYLNDLDLFYDKMEEASITFTNIQPSEVIENEYVFLAIYFESEFKSQNITIDKPYQKSQRVATVKAEKVNGNWEPIIVSVGFYKPEVHTMFDEGKLQKEVVATQP
ncbi:MAG: hypothetical protein KTR26_11645 [Flammeovirgaceae bacterium]|nr:hypothetical protein [Flammeovirgaceae bacterium]